MLDFSRNHFELFDLPVSYAIDRDKVRQVSQDYQKQLHPDRYASASDQERRMAMQASTHINEAQDVLLDPVRRAHYLLAMHGRELAKEQTTSDMDFLMQQMALREKLEALSKGNDMDAVEAFLDEAEQGAKGVQEVLQECFEVADEVALDKAEQYQARLQFMLKLAREADAVLARLEDELS